ncbi:MAG: isochorismatase [Deltaproteobacteria bacterium]|nr:isochorismatase [Deltaproteobacteria bacterium]
MANQQLPVPLHFDPDKVGEVWRVLYQERAEDAKNWAAQHKIETAHRDEFRICLLLVDVQNTFCIPGFELFVGGRSGTAAGDDNRKLCEFIYRYLGVITRICPTMDTHRTLQIFHSIFLVDDKGEHPAPYTLISTGDVEKGLWKLNPEIARSLNVEAAEGQKFLHHYTERLKKGDKYELTIWPYHAMMGGIGHALVSAVEEAVFFHGIARCAPTDFQVKGENPFTENYSVLRPEVTENADGDPIAEKNTGLIQKLLNFDAVIIAGQAKSHCVAWTVDDLLREIGTTDQTLAQKVYLLEDCTSPVVIPDGVDYTNQADSAFQRFSDAGIHLCRSTDPLEIWPGIAI